jgi:hypothetical protein
MAPVLWLLPPAAAIAQSRSILEVSATTDERRRGLSWSDGEASASARVDLPLGGFDTSARISALRGSARHAGADLVSDLTLGTAWDLAGIRVRVSATGHLFTGASEQMDYVEVGAGGSYTLGPLQIDAGANFAPSQKAIGGSNMYMFAGAAAGIAATPITGFASVGRSLGDDRDGRSHRLRPGGDYTDWRIGADYVLGQLTVGLDYTGTQLRNNPNQIVADPHNSGDRLLARVQLNL